MGVTHENFTPANISRAAIEGVIAGIAYAADGLEALGVKSSRVLLIGGASRNRAVQKITAEIFGQDIYVPEPGEYVADGAAKQAAWALSGNNAPPSWGSGDYEKISCTSYDPAVKQRYFDAIRAI